ncbi:uncharacterized protein LOC131173105 [Hevea brasiliensis]|uniref:uncharacterized protein LOC131173105 n=1 Tax=Hevea brasiliensis TaxID=3981 RepID=UPI0025DD2CB5|nr:uncharacterized protein LOC131173105 [Hevea brasiliensis]
MTHLKRVAPADWRRVAARIISQGYLDFVMELQVAFNRHDSIWVIVDKLHKIAHFIPVRANYFVDKLAQVNVAEIIRLHKTPVTIVFDRGPQFTLRFWHFLLNE